MSILAAKKLSVIIVNYKSENNLLRSLLSLFDLLKNIDCEIIIINNDKKGCLVEVEKKFSEVKIIEQNKNIGFGSAVNMGAKMATGEIFFLLNPDTEIVSRQFQDIFNEFFKNKETGIIGSCITDFFGQVQPWIAGTRKNFWDLLQNNLGIKKSKKIWKTSQKIEASWVAATAMFIRGELFLELGGFDENFFMYFEDVDLCERAKKEGKKIIYFPDFKVKHLNGASFKDKGLQKKYYYVSQEYYFKKHCQKWEWALIKLIGKFFCAL